MLKQQLAYKVDLIHAGCYHLLDDWSTPGAHKTIHAESIHDKSKAYMTKAH